MFRSVLYVPGNVEKMIAKISSLDSDCYAIDLEDSVPGREKKTARELLRRVVPDVKKNTRGAIITRVNPLSSKECKDDVDAAMEVTDGILVPKIETVQDIDKIVGMVPRKSKMIFVMIETAKGLSNVKEICNSGKLSGVIFGSFDLAREMTFAFELDRSAVDFSRFMISLSATSAGISAIDGVYANYKDSSGFEEECKAVRKLGFSGKSLIHPSQIEIANRVFSPTDEEVRYARRVIDTMNQATKEGRASASLDGSMIDIVHLRQAKKIVDLAKKFHPSAKLQN